MHNLIAKVSPIISICLQFNNKNVPYTDSEKIKVVHFLSTGRLFVYHRAVRRKDGGKNLYNLHRN